ncbi:MAG: hypothetical protein Q4E76_01110 [Tissierellia bacterium]|nr:hypothetical protein [Tissierellia bacterium]
MNWREKISETYLRGYSWRLRLETLFLSLLLLDQWPGLDGQRLIPTWAFVILATAAYFLLLRGAELFVRRFLHFLLPPATLELTLLAVSYWLHREVLVGASNIVSGNDRVFFLLPLILILITFLSGWIYFRRTPLWLKVLWSLLPLAALSFFLLPGIKGPEESTQVLREIPPKYQVEVLSYGPGSQWSVGSSSYTRRASFTPFQRKLRKKIKGYDLSNIPHGGIIYLPEGLEEAPTLFFIHGNHNMLTESHLGYDYLGRYLAARGVAFVSVDETLLNGYMGSGAGNENDVRALLLLDNMSSLTRESEDPQSELYRRLNPQAYYVGGHSRGGEGAATAASLTAWERLLDDGRALELDFTIRGVVAVAPTYGQYLPAGHQLPLKLPYFLIHGSHDMDVARVQGLDQYAHATGEKYQWFLPYANHGQFNELWGRRDKAGLKGLHLHTAPIVERRAQEELLSVGTYAFLRHLEGDSSYWNQLEAYLPLEEIYQRGGTGEVLASFQDDLDLTREGEVEISSSSSTWREEALATSGKNSGEERVLAVRLNSGNHLQLKFPPREAASIAFDVAYERAPVALTVEVGGREYSVEEQKPPMETQPLKWQLITGETTAKNSLQTVEIPLEAPEEISEIRITAEGSGLVYFDDFRIELPPKND